MDITKFIAHFGIIELSIGTALGIGYKELITNITRDIFKPILQYFFRIKELDNYYVNIIGINFGVGNVILALINFSILLGFIFITMYLLLSPLIDKILAEKTRSDKKNIEQNTKVIQILSDIRDKNKKVYGYA